MTTRVMNDMRILKDNKILSILRCPICGNGMSVPEGKASLVCGGERKHCYDFASSGYVNLCYPMQSGGGDSKQAVRARSEFLDKGHYRPVAEELARMAVKYGKCDDVLLDAGCGEGYYSSFICDAGFSVIGADLSKFAVDAASKRLARINRDNFLFTTASVFALPVTDGSVGIVTNVFAPCAEDEYSRVLKKDGVLIVAWAGENHLMGLKRAIYNTANANTERADLPVYMKKIEEIRVSYTIDLTDNGEIKSLFAMTPYYWRTSVADMEKLKELDFLTTEVDIIISVYKKDN